MSARAGEASFGDVTGEYLALRTEAAYVTGWHELVWVRGPDAVRFLDGLVSQAVAPLGGGAVAPSLLLAPQGKLRAPHHLLSGQDEVGLVVDAGIGEIAASDLRRFKIRVDVTVELDPGPVVDVWGPAAAAAVSAVTGSPVRPDGGWERTAGAVVVAAIPFRRVGLPRLVVAGVGEPAYTGAGVVRAGRLAADAVRIEAGEPLMGIDLDDGTIPQEGDLVDGAVDFAKGCYLGQELVARIDSRGHVNRVLRGIVVTTNLLPPIGADIVTGDRVVGALTSVGESLTLRAPVGLAMVRREVDPGAVVAVRWSGGEAPGRVAGLPLDTFAAP